MMQIRNFKVSVIITAHIIPSIRKSVPFRIWLKPSTKHPIAKDSESSIVFVYIFLDLRSRSILCKIQEIPNKQVGQVFTCVFKNDDVSRFNFTYKNMSLCLVLGMFKKILNVYLIFKICFFVICN